MCICVTISWLVAYARFVTSVYSLNKVALASFPRHTTYDTLVYITFFAVLRESFASSNSPQYYPMHYKQKYPPILPHKHWPIVQLNKQREAFVRAVVDTSVQTILATYPDTDSLQAMLSQTAALEQVRIQKKSWRVDPPDDAAFWEQVVTSLAGKQPGTLPAVLRQIVKRYAYELMGRFRMGHYQLGERAITYTLGRLLNPVSLQGVRVPWKRRTRLQEKICITGAITQLRALARVGTVVMVPTHSSHLDSVLLGWVTHMLGLPHFTYGAGLNLFNNKFFAYFMNNLGAYKIDRRRKSFPYLTTLKTYATLALQWGCHSLFYPGGTRSRSGALERRLKLGLLGTVLEAQQRNYQLQGTAARKIFVVPVVLSYHCVLEAPLLVKSYLATQGQFGLGRTRAPYTFSQKLLKMAENFFVNDSRIFVSIGAPMDVLGHRVDEAGCSYDAQGRAVDTYQHCAAVEQGGSQHSVQVKTLAKAIVATYYKANCVLTSHLLAFAAFVLFKQQHAGLSLHALLRLPPAQLVIPYAQLEATFALLRTALLRLHQAGEVQVEPALQATDVAALVQLGLRNLGLYHARRPLCQDKAGAITTQDLCTLWYYHNRLQGYDLDKHVS